MADTLPQEIPELSQPTTDNAAPSLPPLEEAPVALEPEEAQEQTLPPDNPPPPVFEAKKPPLILVAVSFGIIVLFIIGLLVITAGSKNKNSPKQQAQYTTPTDLPTIAPTKTPPSLSPTVQPDTFQWRPYSSSSKVYKIDVPADMDVIYDSINPAIAFCNISHAVETIHISEKNKEGEILTVTVSKYPASEETPDSWVKTNCKELLGTDLEKGMIDEDGVKGLYYIRKYSGKTPTILPYNLAVLQKGKKLYFVYAQAQSDEVMSSLFDPMFLSFKLLAQQSSENP